MQSCREVIEAAFLALLSLDSEREERKQESERCKALVWMGHVKSWSKGELSALVALGSSAAKSSSEVGHCTCA